jgi:hypothetical protein
LMETLCFVSIMNLDQIFNHLNITHIKEMIELRMSIFPKE